MILAAFAMMIGQVVAMPSATLSGTETSFGQRHSQAQTALEHEEAGLALPPRAGGKAGAASQHLCVTDAGLSFQAVAGRILGDPDLPLEWVEVV